MYKVRIAFSVTDKLFNSSLDMEQIYSPFQLARVVSQRDFNAEKSSDSISLNKDDNLSKFFFFISIKLSITDKSEYSFIDKTFLKLEI